MHIVHVSAELAKVAKVGGLADMVYGLAKELVHLQADVEVILPKYACLDTSHLKKFHADKQKVLSKTGKNSVFENTIWSGILDGIKITFIEPHHPLLPFDREEIYGFADDVLRFSLFSRTVLDYLCQRGKKVDVLHVHDWQTALIPVLYTHLFKSKDFCVGKTVLTLHNLDYQGKYSKKEFPLEGLENSSCLEDAHQPDLVNLLQGGIIAADIVTTVSPNYKKEIQTPEGGCGLHLLLQEHSSKLHGILNGIDPHFWNPKEDPFLIYPYETSQVTSLKEIGKVLHAKEHNKRHLYSLLNLQFSDKPLVAAITRLVPQKGPDLLIHAIRRTLSQGGQFILLGSCPIPELKTVFEKLRLEFEKDPNVRVILEHDEPLAHLLFAAAELLIIPSIFEPCGLTQMIAMRYGTIPIARLSGGLADTVFDVETSTRPLADRNGFTFDYPDAAGVNWALDRALSYPKEQKDKWHSLLLHAMQKDFTWKNPAREYLKLYAL